jgi:hypothetical protein
MKGSGLQSKPHWTGRISVVDLLINDGMQWLDVPIRANGRIDLDADFSTSGLTFDSLWQALKGQAEIDLNEFELLDVNFLSLFLNKLSFIPGLQKKIYEKMSVRTINRINYKNTSFEDMKLFLEILPDKIHLLPVNITTEDFTFRIELMMDKAEKATVPASLTLSQPLTVDFISAVDEFRLFQNDQGLFEVPFESYQGPIQQYRPSVNVKEISSMILQKRGQAEINKALNRLFKRAEDPESNENMTTNSVEDLHNSSNNPSDSDTDSRLNQESFEVDLGETVVTEALDLLLGL